MLKRWLIIVVAVVLIAAGAYLGFDYLSVDASAPGSDDLVVEIPVEAGQEIIAEGRVVPVDEATALFATGGTVRQVLVAEGELVSVGQDLARLDARPMEIKLEQAVAQAQAAQARLDLADLGPDAIDLAASLAAIDVARANVQSAQGGVSSARAQLARTSKPASTEEIAIGQHQIEQAKNSRWAAHAQRDAVCGRVGKGAQEADCDAAQAAVQQAEQQASIAGLQLDPLLARPEPEDVASAQALLEQAEGQLAVAEAQVLQSEANHRLSAKEPSPEAIRAAQSDLAQAEAAVRQAQLALGRRPPSAHGGHRHPRGHAGRPARRPRRRECEDRGSLTLGR